jgi:hypothetical protein
MSTRASIRVLAALTATVVGAVAAACASIPTSGEVRDGAANIEVRRDVDYIPVGPAAGATPDQIVQGFLTASVVGPRSTASYAVAQEYLEPSAASGWDRYARVLVLQESPRVTAGEVPDDATTATVQAEAIVVATVDENGVYTEQPTPSTVETAFTLVRGRDGQWRISQLEDGLLISASFFTQAFHLTRLYFPTPDLTWWVPDVRWFPHQTWRTDATAQILAGPPAWLGNSTTTVIPEGTALAIDAVTVSDDGTIDVSLTSPIAQASAEERALAVAQLEAALVEGEGRTVVLSEATAPLAVPSEVDLALPHTEGDAVAVSHGELHRVVARQLEPFDEEVALDGLDPTALAVAPGGSPVVVRDGDDRLVRVTGVEAPARLLVGSGLLAPSIDRFGAVWSGEARLLQVVLASTRVVDLPVAWLEGRSVDSVSVSPEGARIVVVSRGPGGRQVHVAGIMRDAQNVPTGLSDPIAVAGPVDDVSLATWQDATTLALVGSADGVPSVFLAGVGGLASQGGLSRPLAGVVEPRTVTADVGTSGMLAIDGDGTLLSRQTSALWSAVADDVDLVAYPG